MPFRQIIVDEAILVHHFLPEVKAPIRYEGVLINQMHIVKVVFIVVGKPVVPR